MSDQEQLDRISGYGKVWNYFDASVKAQFLGCCVEIEEKVDGSQFSAMRVGERWRFRSKGVEVHPANAGMFDLAVEGASSMDLRDGWVYRFEYLRKPKHNTLAYERVPTRNLILFEVETEEYAILGHDDMHAESERLGIECVPLLHRGSMASFDQVTDEFLKRTSCLGRELIEGIVIKARDRRHNTDGKVLKAKVVSSRFKERHGKEWRRANPTSKDIITEIGESLNTEARFRKVVHRLRDRGELEGGLRDIGVLMAELGRDLKTEEEEYVKDVLYKWAWPRIQRKAMFGFPQFYKDLLSLSSPSGDEVKEEQVGGGDAH